MTETNKKYDLEERTAKFATILSRHCEETVATADEAI